MNKDNQLLIVLLSICTVGVLSYTFLGGKGLVHLWELRKELKSFEMKKERLVEENLKLREEIVRLRSDLRYIEKVAREELGMVRDNEIIFQFDQ